MKKTLITLAVALPIALGAWYFLTPNEPTSLDESEALLDDNRGNQGGNIVEENTQSSSDYLENESAIDPNHIPSPSDEVPGVEYEEGEEVKNVQFEQTEVQMDDNHETSDPADPDRIQLIGEAQQIFDADKKNERLESIELLEKEIELDRSALNDSNPDRTPQEREFLESVLAQKVEELENLKNMPELENQ